MLLQAVSRGVAATLTALIRQPQYLSSHQQLRQVHSLPCVHGKHAAEQQQISRSFGADAAAESSGLRKPSKHIEADKIENALLAAAANRDQARQDAEAARLEAAAQHCKKERQEGIVQELKAQLLELEWGLKGMVNTIVTRSVLDREEDKMEYGSGIKAWTKGRNDLELKRLERWACWVEEHPDAAAAMAKNLGYGWRPQDIPSEAPLLCEALRDCSDLIEPPDFAASQESSSGAAGAADSGKKGKRKRGKRRRDEQDQSGKE